MSSSAGTSLIALIFSLLFVNFSIAGYVLEDDYTVSTFFDMFTFYTEADPTNGFVEFVDQSTAQDAGYIGTIGDAIYIGTDNTSVTSTGRESIRLSSNKTYNTGNLVILDLAHMPGGICGIWPAFWMVGPSWPSGGEIDIIEGVNLQDTNAMTLHTESGVTITDTGNFTGTISTYDCYVDATDQSSNAGCSIDSSDTASFGSGFNDNGGGVYVTEITDDSINIWYFSRYNIPDDVASGAPVPSTSWGTPAAQFMNGWLANEFFYDLNIVFDLTFCGDWAGDAWSSGTCSSYADTCNDYVGDNPSAFTDAYWAINSLKVYQYSATESSGSGSSSSSSSAYTSSSTQAISAAPSSTYSASSTPSTSPGPQNHSKHMGGKIAVSGSSYAASSSAAAETSSPVVSANASIEVPASTSQSTPSSTQNASSVETHLAQVASSSTQSSSMVPSSVSYSSTTLVPSVRTTISTSIVATSSSIAASSSIVADVAADGSTEPTSVAEMLSAAQEMAEEWSTTQPTAWRDNIKAVADELSAAASQEAAISASLAHNSRRHVLEHKRRFGGSHMH